MELPVRRSSCRKGSSKGVLHQILERVSLSNSDERPDPRNSSSSSSMESIVRLPHTITERHGGKELWVTAPVLSEYMEKRGFSWRKKWRTRFLELNGRVLSYYEVKKKGKEQKPASTPRRQVFISADAELEEIDDVTFAIIPDACEKPWFLRAKDAKTKLKWCKALTDCIDILNWLQHYTVGDVLGVGGNGVVKQLVDRRNGDRFAVKVVDASKFRNREAVVQEVEILRNITNTIRHPNLVQIYKVYEEQEKIYLILELCEGGELYDRVVQKGKYSEADAAHIMRQLMSAIQALHQHNILHLDIKPENVLFAGKEEDARIVLTDFGLARMVNGTKNPLQEGQSMAGTVGYIAPEVITSHMYSPAADVFSAGVILYILLVGYPPFYGDTEIEILLKIARGDYQFHPSSWAHISDEAKDLVAKMLSVRAQDRITIPEILEHPWLAKDRNPAEEPDLKKTLLRMKSYNFERKSGSMANWLSTMMLDANVDDHLALMDKQNIEMLIRRLSPSGRIPVDRAHVLARALGVSPYVDEKSLVEFLDQNQDGWIDAADFCQGVESIHQNDASFARIIFRALLSLVGHNGATLHLEHFRCAFERLHCPEPLVSVFFKEIQRTESGDVSPEDETPEEACASFSDEKGVDEVGFQDLIKRFPFIGGLFLHSARSRMVSIVRGKEESLEKELLEQAQV